MIATPAAYAPFPQVRRVRFSAEFRLTDLHAAENATISSTAQAAVSRADQTLGNIKTPSWRFASLEPNLWLLDGSLQCVDAADENEAVGWWSYWLSQEDRTFLLTAQPTVTYALSAPASSIGFTLFFDADSGAPPAEVVTKVYSGNTVLATQTDACGESMLLVERPVENYDRVTFTFTKSTMPRRHVRLLGVAFGIVKVYTPDNLAKASITYGADPIAETFPSRQLKMTIDNSQKEYNLRNPNSIYAYLQDGQLIEAEMLISGVSVDLGKFYFAKATAKDSGLTAELQANDRAYGWDGAVYSPGSHTNEVVTLATAVSYVLSGRGTTVAYASGIQSRTVRVSPPEDSSIREVLRLLAQAARCAVWFDRGGVLRFAELPVAETAMQEYTGNELYSMDAITVRDKVDKVTVNIARKKIDSGEELYSYGSGDNEVKVSNPCVAPANGDAVAKWIFDYYARRLGYSFKNRGDPAVDIGDTVAVADTFGEPGLAVVTSIDMEYSGGLFIKTGGVGP